MQVAFSKISKIIKMVNCAITAGYTMDCNKDSLGGLAKVMMAAKGDITSYTKTDNKVTAITMASTKKFWNFDLVTSTSNYSNTFTANAQNGSFFYAQSLGLVFNKVKQATSAVVDSLARNSIVAIVEDRNGEVVILGLDNGLDLSGGTVGSGTAGGDRNGYDLQFTGEEAEMVHVDPAIVDALLTAAS